MFVSGRKLGGILLALAAISVLALPSLNADVISAGLRGAVRPAGTGIGSPSATQNYSVGGGSNFKNFFSFDTSSITNQWATTGSEVQIEHSINSNNQPGTFSLFEVNESVSTYSAALWNDIGANTAYGSVAVTNAGVGFANVVLNTDGLSGLNNVLTGSTEFVVGGLTTTSMFNGSGSDTFRSRIDISLTANSDPTAATDDYAIFFGDGVTLDGSLSDDADIVPFGDSIVSYVWTVNGMAAGTSASSMLSLSDAQLSGLGVSSPGTYAVGLTVTDEWGATDLATASLLVSVPEPGSMVVLCFAAVGLATTRKRRV